MNLDEIQDIEVLINQLKKMMCKCIKEIELENFEGKKKTIKVGEYLKFHIDYSNDFICVTDFQGYSISDYENEFIKEYFEFPKEGDSDINTKSTQ